MALNNKTVLILGAGASAPYGFPLGAELLKQIKQGLLPNGGIHRAATNEGYSAPYITEFLDGLIKSQTTSIDDFLSLPAWSNFTKLGKFSTAYVIARYENLDSLFAENITGHWYQQLWLKIRNSINSLGASNLKIITFNYDRSLETYITNCIKHTKRCDSKAAEAFASELSIVHVYGSLGSAFTSIQNDAIPYGSISKLETNSNESISQISGMVQASSESIILIPEARKENLQANQASIIQSLKWCSRLCFLGFGYDAANLETLKINDFLNFNNEKQKKVDILGTKMGFSHGAYANLINKIPFTRINGDINLDQNDNCLSYIQKRSIFDNSVFYGGT